MSLLLAPIFLLVGGFPLLWPLAVLALRGADPAGRAARRQFEAGFLGFAAGGGAFILTVLGTPRTEPGFIDMRGIEVAWGGMALVALFWVVWVAAMLSWLVRASEPLGWTGPRLKGLAGLVALMVLVGLSRIPGPWKSFSGWLGN